MFVLIKKKYFFFSFSSVLYYIKCKVMENIFYGQQKMSPIYIEGHTHIQIGC